MPVPLLVTIPTIANPPLSPGTTVPTALKSVVVDNRSYDWEGDRPLRIPYSASVIYEMHVGGFTRHPSSGLP
jgi:isoamylase